MTETITRKQFKVDDYYQMLEVGIIHPDDRVELIEGEIVQKSPMSSQHGGCINYLNQKLSSILNKSAIVSSQVPTHLSEISEPEPDMSILKYRNDYYRNSHAEAQDIHFVIEVSHTTLKYDLNVKVPMYAKHNIPEVWVIDLEKNEVHQFSQPIGEQYKEHIILNQGESIQSKQLSDVTLPINDILGIES